MTSSYWTAPPDVAVISTVGERRFRVAARGEFDLATAPLLDVAVREVYWGPSRARPDRFVLDLTGVTFLDVSGVRALGRIHRIVRDHRGLLDVAGPAAYEPCRLLDLAVDEGWLPEVFRVRRTCGPPVSSGRVVSRPRR